ncbi:MAG: DUF1614 domain-containing protein [Methanobacteriota archaeon]
MIIESIVLYIFYILIPILAIYLGYLIITKAFNEMGFTSLEAIIIVFGSFLLGSGLIDRYVGFPFANIPLFMYQNWQVGMNTGGAVIPLLLSAFLIIKHKLPLTKILLGVVLVAGITYLVTYPDPEKGIVSVFPLWLLPVIFASISSIFLLWKTKRNAAPVAYITGTIGVLLGADLLHLFALLSIEIKTTQKAVIGGANIFDMIFLTGILAVLLDGIFLFNKKKKKQE